MLCELTSLEKSQELYSVEVEEKNDSTFEGVSYQEKYA